MAPQLPRSLVAVLVVLSACCISAAPANITVMGYGRVQSASDTVSITCSVSKLAPLASDARRNVSDAVNGIVSTLSQTNLGTSTISVQTTSLSVSPDTQYNSVTRAYVKNGQKVQQSLLVYVGNVTAQSLASVVDAIVKTGDASISSISFGLAAPTRKAITMTARTKAAQDALGTARLYAQAAGAELGPVTSLREVSVQVTSVGAYSSDEGPMEAGLARVASIGEQAVTVSVAVSYELVALRAAPAAAATGG